ncbi:MAG: winged helix-turn-helix domain-containing protein [Candidatus Eremiobacteraeota bacterium]|nr:winged helix-turn-helix domain-containing protein [Candidatus Eremiobacteraeota bacterium]
MEERRPDLVSFGPYTLSRAERVLRYCGNPVVLAPKTLDVLFELASDVNSVVSKYDLIERVWPDNYVDESNLAQNIYVLRQLFKQHASGIAIENIPKRGYRLATGLARDKHDAQQVASPNAPRYRRAFAVGGVACALLAVFAFAPRVHNGHRQLSSDALAQYMVARTYQAEGSPQNLKRAGTLFSAVVRDSPESAEGYAGLAETNASLAFYEPSDIGRAQLRAKALELARQAVSRDANSADAYAALGGVEFSISHETEPAQSDFQHALALNPNHPRALVWYGTLLLDRGRVAEARRMFGRALGIEPNSPGTVASLAWSDYVARDYVGAITLSKQMLVIGELPWLAHITLANAYIGARDYPGARREIDALSRNPQTRYESVALRAQVDALTGHASLATRVLRQLDATADTRETGGWTPPRSQRRIWSFATGHTRSYGSTASTTSKDISSREIRDLPRLLPIRIFLAG